MPEPMKLSCSGQLLRAAQANFGQGHSGNRCFCMMIVAQNQGATITDPVFENQKTAPSGVAAVSALGYILQLVRSATPIRT